VLQLEVLILEFRAVDRLATSTISSSEVTTLAHEIRDDAVEGAALETEALLASAECTKVLASLRDHVVSEGHDNAAKRCLVGGHVEEDLERTHRKSGGVLFR